MHKQRAPGTQYFATRTDGSANTGSEVVNFVLCGDDVRVDSNERLGGVTCGAIGHGAPSNLLYGAMGF